MKNDVIDLVTVETYINGSGFRQEGKRHVLEVMSEIKSVKYDEFYKAMYSGVSVQLIAAVNIEDYEESIIRADGKKIRPSLVEYDGTVYRIIRVWMKNNRIELTLQEVE